MVSIIAAMGKGRELGFKNKLPWHLHDDLKRFKEITGGHPVIMGRKTHEAIGGPLPGRKNIVVTRDPDYRADGCVVAHTIEEAFTDADNDGGEVFVIGGAEIYKLALPYAQKMYLTFVDAEPEADVFFPQFSEDEWIITKTEIHKKDERHPYEFIFKIYERKKE